MGEHDELLRRYLPRLRYDSNEQYFADSPAPWTDNPGHELRHSGQRLIARAPSSRSASACSARRPTPSRARGRAQRLHRRRKAPPPYVTLRVAHNDSRSRSATSLRRRLGGGASSCACTTASPTSPSTPGTPAREAPWHGRDLKSQPAACSSARGSTPAGAAPAHQGLVRPRRTASAGARPGWILEGNGPSSARSTSRWATPRRGSSGVHQARPTSPARSGGRPKPQQAILDTARPEHPRPRRPGGLDRAAIGCGSSSTSSVPRSRRARSSSRRLRATSASAQTYASARHDRQDARHASVRTTKHFSVYTAPTTATPRCRRSRR